MFQVIIPARYASTRLPAKMLELIGGLPMVVRVLQQALKSNAARVIVAVDDERIYNALQGYGATVVMTSQAHETGTDRIAEVIDLLNIAPETILVNVQGDEPFIPPSLINQLAEHLERTDALMGSLYDTLDSKEEFLNPNQVKVVLDDEGNARYFSRAPIPYHSDLSRIDAKGHIGLYAYKAHFVKTFCSWPRGALEKMEKLEQLRALEHGVNIAMLKTNYMPHSVDTQEDLDEARRLFAKSTVRP